MILPSIFTTLIITMCVKCCRVELRVETVCGARLLATGYAFYFIFISFIFQSSKVLYGVLYIQEKNGSSVFVDSAMKCVIRSRSQHMSYSRQMSCLYCTQTGTEEKESYIDCWRSGMCIYIGSLSKNTLNSQFCHSLPHQPARTHILTQDCLCFFFKFFYFCFYLPGCVCFFAPSICFFFLLSTN